MSNDSSLKAQIIATVIGGLLLTLIVWIVGFLPIVWEFLKLILLGGWKFLVVRIAIPVWALILIVVLLVHSFRFMYKARRADKSKSDENPILDTEPRLTDLETKVLTNLGHLDGRGMVIEYFVDVLSTNRLRVEQALDSLIQKGLIQRVKYSAIEPVQYHLTSSGRDFLIKHNYV